jgi:hypothetical protein
MKRHLVRNLLRCQPSSAAEDTKPGGRLLFYFSQTRLKYRDTRFKCIATNGILIHWISSTLCHDWLQLLLHPVELSWYLVFTEVESSRSKSKRSGGGNRWSVGAYASCSTVSPRLQRRSGPPLQGRWSLQRTYPLKTHNSHNSLL